MSDVMLRTSERNLFKRCQWAWERNYIDRLENANRFSPALWFGTGIHLALEKWYIPGAERGVHPVETWKAYCDEARADTQVGPYGAGGRGGGGRAGDRRGQDEVVAAVLQREAPARRHDAGAEAHVVAVDERARVARAIHDAKVDGVGAGGRRAALLIEGGAGGADQLAAVGGVLLGEELVDR